ncbi:hypothetical protein SLEP1_g15041 [Rubroshorea leprosula]|uniref:Cyclin n=1 Tax=Rubroshorea leprosula TaxID=152421 RepID=A0AAV5IXS5_9ROSI|nr:hypothetical protein SLEP1_g15041 [Rubroshorea leprosula]
MSSLYSSQLTSILAQSLLMLKKNSLCEYLMRMSFGKSVVPFTSLIKFRLTCVYAACKIEENHVSAEELGKGIPQDHQIILNYEMTVYQSLEFDLIVYAPYHSIEGFVNDIEEFCGTNDEQTQMLKVTYAIIL